MKKMLNSRIFWGILVIVGGVMALLDNLGVIGFSDLFWAIIAGLGAAFFLSIFFQNRSYWWSLIPGVSLIGIALSIVLNWLNPEIGSIWGGAVFLGMVGLSFFCVYLVDRTNWWAIIPAGVMVTIGVVSSVDQAYESKIGTGFFFLGVGITFALLPLLPSPAGKMGWAWIPALALAALGAFFLFASGEKIAYLGPLVLIGIGLLLVIRSLIGTKRDQTPG